mgnify:CR=1 FL=1|jgi:hypothetical protein
MDDHDDFFGDIFQGPEDDPLLDGADDEPAGGRPTFWARCPVPAEAPR